jgi:hypothetical protein
MKKMKSLCLIGCGKKKIWDKNPEISSIKAKNVYTGSFTKKCIEYAEKFYPDSWCILSAKHGFLFPNEKIHSNYSECFHHKKSNHITIKELKLQIKNKELDKYDKIIIIGGNYYTELIKNLFPKKKVFNPLSECKGIGHMMKKLNESIE